MFDVFLCFQISEKWANLRFPLNIQKQKVFQLQVFQLLFQLCPWTPLGTPPPALRIYGKSCTVSETRIFQAADSEGLVILACTVYD